ncbi:hypothetical protein SteCoe_11676 [Stentor coeruleus]|uniref:Rab-GAP TBC domain-containing protein n=1 Tax=Stentor coeruleus TaxID=5963 RepID=A0A1R2CCQ0_9CILI|nr:hypothetical protein SteCoe_11676 [Stentor coeruleus]
MADICQILEEYVILDHQFPVFSKNEWVTILKDNDIFRLCPNRLRISVCNGIPSSLRGDIWVFLSRSSHLQASSKPYQEYVNGCDDCVEKMILKDIGRTFPHELLFKSFCGFGQTCMFNILKAYASYDSDIGYCQGMNFIVGTLLMYLSEEKAFWTFVSIMFEKNWRELFKEETPKLTKLLHSLKIKLKEKCPEVYNHLKSEGIEMTVFAKYFLTFFMCEQEKELGVRVLDSFLCFGENEILEIINTALLLERKKILGLKYEELFMFCAKELGKRCLDVIKGNIIHVNEIDDDYTML